MKIPYASGQSSLVMAPIVLGGLVAPESALALRHTRAEGELIRLVLDTLTSTHSKRSYRTGLERFFAWLRAEGAGKWRSSKLYRLSSWTVAAVPGSRHDDAIRQHPRKGGELEQAPRKRVFVVDDEPIVSKTPWSDLQTGRL